MTMSTEGKISEKRMRFWAELRWIIGGYFLIWALELMQNEMSDEAAMAWGNLGEHLAPDSKHEIVKMRGSR